MRLRDMRLQDVRFKSLSAGLMGAGLLGLMLSTSATVRAQDEAKPQQEQAKPDEAKPMQDEAKPMKQDEAKPDKNEKQQEKQDEKQNKDMMKQSKEQDRPMQAGGDHATKAQGGQRIPDAKFKSNFGRQHTFKVRTTVVQGQPRFQYSGYWFTLSNPWPGDWAYTDDCYIDYINGEYVLIDLLHPGVEIPVVVIVE
ncbi:MAG: hypothetical protein WB919_17940 [Candidatus Sulfotelmatobacter sp.]